MVTRETAAAVVALWACARGDEACRPFGLPGFCTDDLLHEVADVEALFCVGGGASTACTVYRNFVEPAMEVLELLQGPGVAGSAAVSNFGLPSLCVGDFDGGEVADYAGQAVVGGTVLPLAAGRSYGMFGVSVPLPVEVQVMLGLTPDASAGGGGGGGGDEEDEDPADMEVALCTAVVLPGVGGCGGGLTFAVTVNDDAMEVVNELLAGKNPVMKAALEAGLDHVTLAISTDARLEVSAQVYTHRGWEQVDLAAHLALAAGFDFDIPNVPEGALVVHGEVTDFYRLGGGAAAAIDALVGADDASAAETMAAVVAGAGFERGVKVEGSLALLLRDLTKGVLQDQTLQLGGALLYFSVNPDGGGRNLPIGLYFSLTADALRNAGAVLDELCQAFAGAFKQMTGGANVRCPSINLGSAKLGLYLNEDGMGLAAQLSPAVSMECKVQRLFSGRPEFRCRFPGLLRKVLKLVADGLGFVVSELEEWGDDVGRELYRVGADAGRALKTAFGKKGFVSAMVTGGVSGNALKKALRELRDFFSGSNSGSHEEVEFGFKTGWRCRTPGYRRFLFNTADAAFADWDNAYRGHNREECFNQCYLHAVERFPDTYEAENVCCEFTKFGNNNRERRCLFSLGDRVATSNAARSVTKAAVADFEALARKLVDGEACAAHGACLSGKCHQGVCKSVCTGTDPCASDEEFHWCNGHQQCASGFCNTAARECQARAGLGASCVADAQCWSGKCHEDVCKVRCRTNAKCSGREPYHYCQSNDECAGGRNRCRNDHRCRT